MRETRKSPELRIGELAAKFGLNPKTIRFYEEIGLLTATKRTSAGYRLYDETDRKHLRLIVKAKAVGMTLSEIREILTLRRDGELPCERVFELLDQKLVAIDEKIRALSEFQRELLELRREARELQDADTCVCQIIEQHKSLQTEGTRVTAVLNGVPR